MCGRTIRQKEGDRKDVEGKSFLCLSISDTEEDTGAVTFGGRGE